MTEAILTLVFCFSVSMLQQILMSPYRKLIRQRELIRLAEEHGIVVPDRFKGVILLIDPPIADWVELLIWQEHARQFMRRQESFRAPRFEPVPASRTWKL